jgi:hypothetical protein
MYESILYKIFEQTYIRTVSINEVVELTGSLMSRLACKVYLSYQCLLKMSHRTTFINYEQDYKDKKRFLSIYLSSHISYFV